MTSEGHIVALDLSIYSTGFAIFKSNGELVEHGVLKPSLRGLTKHTRVSKSLSIMLRTATLIKELVEKWNPIDIVVEEITGSVFRLQQKSLDGFHFIVFSLIQDRLDKLTMYDVSGANGWRYHLNLRLSAHERDINKTRRKMNRSLHKSNQLPMVNHKHLSCSFANSVFGLNFNFDKDSSRCR